MSVLGSVNSHVQQSTVRMMSQPLSSFFGVKPDARQTIEINLTFFLIAEVWLTCQHPLRTIDAPPHRQRARVPTIDPTNNPVLIGTDQVCDRNAFKLKFFHWLLTFCIVALQLVAWH